MRYSCEEQQGQQEQKPLLTVRMPLHRHDTLSLSRAVH